MRKKLLIAGAVLAAVAALLVIVSPPGPRKVNGEYHVYASDEGRAILMKFYQDSLGKWTVPYQELDVDTSFGKTHIITAGDAKNKPLLLLHGAGSSAASWFYGAAELTRHYRIYAIDTMGDLGRSRPVKLPASEDDYARWLDETMAALGLGKASVLGISYGGFLAHCLVSRHPEKVDRAILASYSYMSSGIGPGTMARMIWYTLSPTTENMRKELVWLNGGSLGKALDRAEFIDAFAATARYGRNSIINPTGIAEEAVKKITVPIMIVIGDRDPIYTIEKSRDYCAATNPAIRFEVIAGEGHLFPINDPSRFSVLVIGFLQGHSRL